PIRWLRKHKKRPRSGEDRGRSNNTLRNQREAALAGGDLADADAGVDLTVASLATRVLAATHLLHDQLRAQILADHLGRDARARKRRTEFQIGVASQRQKLVA